MYSLVCLLGVFLVWFTYLSWKGSTRMLAALAVVQIGLLWSHHFSLFSVAVSWVLIVSGGRIRLRRVAVWVLVVTVAWAPAAWLLSRQVFVFRTGTWLPPPAFDAPLRSVGLWIAGVNGAAHSLVAGVPMALALGAVGAAPLACAGLWRGVGRVAAVLCGGTLALAWIVSRVVPALVPGRYDVVVMPAFILMLAAGWSAVGGRIRVGALALLMSGAALGLVYYFTTYEKGSVRDLVRLINAAEQPADVMVVVPEIEAPVVHYYYRGVLRVLVPPTFERVDRVDYAQYGQRWASDDEAQRLAERCWELVPAGGRIHLIYSPYRSTVHFKGCLMRGAAYTRVTRRVSGSGSTELAILERKPSAPFPTTGRLAQR
jgi:hypothetical protein